MSLLMRQTLLERSVQLSAERVPHVHAQVVLAERPTSAKPGDEAIVLADGTMEGFVGGTCAEATVRDQSLQVLQTGQARLLRISPDPEPDQAGKVVVHNHCLSGGTLEIFLEPAMPSPLVVVAGRAPIAEALVSIGRALGYDVRTSDGDLPDDTSAVVVAAHGRDEEQVLTAALRAGVGYVGLVASPRRGAQVVASLDVDDDLRQRVDTPAGLDIGARTPQEVAVSILAAIIAERPRPAAGGDARPATPDAVDTGSATDPVCGMAVATVEASLHVEHDDALVWFCGRGCLEAFVADPAAFAA